MKLLFILPIFLSFFCKTIICKDNLIAEFLDNQINIDVGFTGKKLSYFGALNTPGDLVIIVTGPRKEIKVLKDKPKLYFIIIIKIYVLLKKG